MDILIDKSNNLSVKGCRYTHKAIRSRPKTIPFSFKPVGKVKKLCQSGEIQLKSSSKPGKIPLFT